MRHLILSSLALVAMTSFAMAGTSQPATVQDGPAALSPAATRLTDRQLDRVAGGNAGLAKWVNQNLVNAASSSSDNALNYLHSLQSAGNGVTGVLLNVLPQNPGTGPL